MSANPAGKDLQDYLDHMSTLTVKLDRDGRVVLANRAAAAAAGMPREQFVGSEFLSGAWYGGQADAADRLRDAFAEALGGRVAVMEDAVRGKGSARHLQVTLSPVLDGAGPVACVIAEGRDVTSLRDAQAALYEVNEGLEESVQQRTGSLEAALREKEMLLREVHHRVKNNLQIISSLLSLQSAQVRDPQVAGLLLESRNRVKSMALVHERLYAGENLGQVGFRGYLEDLAAQLVRSAGPEGRDVRLIFELEDVEVGLSQAIPCGLAVHELVANTLRHAFPEGRAPSGRPWVAIRAWALPEGGFEVEVEDNGRGLPEGFDPRKSRTLGLQLVTTLAHQLKGRLEADRGSGARFRMTIPRSVEKEG